MRANGDRMDVLPVSSAEMGRKRTVAFFQVSHSTNTSQAASREPQKVQRSAPPQTLKPVPICMRVCNCSLSREAV